MLPQYKQCYGKNKKYFLLLGIVIIGAFLRFPGISEGIVHTFQPDEENLVRPAIEMAMCHSLWHNHFAYPGQFISKIAAAFIWIYSKMKQIPIGYNVVEYYFIFRGITAFFSTMTIVAAYFVGEKMEKGVGLLLAGFTALFPQFIIMARQVTGDTTALFFTVLLLWCSLQYLEKRQYRYLVWMSVLAGMATLEKWHSAVACFYIGIVILFTCKGIKNFIKESIMAFLAYIGTMFIIAPNMVMHPNAALEGILSMKNYGGGRESWIKYVSNLKVFYSTADEFGGVVLKIFVLIGIFFIFTKLSRKYLILCMGILKFFIVALLNRGFPRWVLEFYFMLCIIAAIGVYRIFCGIYKEKLSGWKGKIKWEKILVVAGTGLLILRFLSVDILAFMVATHSEHDTRTIQMEYCDNHGISEENSVWDGYTGFSPGGVTIRGGDSVKDRRGILVIEGGVLYKTEPADYAIVNVSRYKDEVTELLEKQCKVVQVFQPVCSDIFWGVKKFNNEGDEPWALRKYAGEDEKEITFITNNIELIKQIYEGSYTGLEIIIYDISNVELL